MLRRATRVDAFRRWLRGAPVFLIPGAKRLPRWSGRGWRRGTGIANVTHDPHFVHVAESFEAKVSRRCRQEFNDG